VKIPTVKEIEAAIKIPKKQWARQCHSVSLAIVQSGLLGRSRVARGFAQGVASQHSWVVCGDDCYDASATIIDATLWSYVAYVPVVWHGTLNDGIHIPHGMYPIDMSQFPAGVGNLIKLNRNAGFTLAGKAWMRRFANKGLCANQWHWLASRAGCIGWPAGDIYQAMYRTRAVSALIPVDRVGMLTRINPGGLYLKE
jgi:hypothetical protein